MSPTLRFHDVEIHLTAADASLAHLLGQALDCLEPIPRTPGEATRRVRLYCCFQAIPPGGEDTAISLHRNRHGGGARAAWTPSPDTRNAPSSTEFTELYLEQSGAWVRRHPVAGGLSLMVDWSLALPGGRTRPELDDAIVLVRELVELILMDSPRRIEASTVTGPGTGWPARDEGLILAGHSPTRLEVIRELERRGWKTRCQHESRVILAGDRVAVFGMVDPEEAGSPRAGLHPITRIVHLVEAGESRQGKPRDLLLSALRGQDPSGPASDEFLGRVLDAASVYRVVCQPGEVESAIRCVMQLLGLDPALQQTPRTLLQDGVSRQVESLKQG